MTFDASERSVFGGKPIELYEWRVGFQYFTYTTDRKEQTHNGRTFTPQAMKRSKIKQSNEINQKSLTITAMWNHPIAQLYIGQPPGSVIFLTVYRTHRNDSEVKTIWKGRTISAHQRGVAAEIYSESNFTSMKRMGLRRHYQTLCPHVLYSTPCGVDRALYRTADDVTAVNGAVLTVPDAALEADGYFNGGFLEYQGELLEVNARIIVSHIGTAITLASPIEQIQVNTPVALYPGCDHTLATCHAKFNAAIDHGGYPFRPDKNPFNTQIF